MLRCMVVDDEAGAVEILSRYIQKAPGMKLVKTFRDSVSALEYLKAHEVDLAFLDIDMPDLSGLRLADMIDRQKTRIIYCTAYSEYAVESYRQGASDYLLKPIAFERFLLAVSKAQRSASPPAAEKGGAGQAAPAYLFCQKRA